MLFELFKNSMRAIIESKKPASDIPDIDVLVAQGTNDVSIKISDQVIATFIRWMRFIIAHEYIYLCREEASLDTRQIDCFTICFQLHPGHHHPLLKHLWPDTGMACHFQDCMQGTFTGTSF